jgi:hypothetical protein
MAAHPLRDSGGIAIKTDRRHLPERRVSVVKQRYVPPCIREIGDTSVSSATKGFRSIPKDIEQDLLMLISLYKEQQKEQAVDLWEKLKEKMQSRDKRN